MSWSKEFDKYFPPPFNDTGLYKDLKSYIKELVEKEIGEIMPRPKKECGCEKSELGYHTKDCTLWEYGWNDCLKVIKEIARKRGWGI
jgi:hypothetical protein